MISYCLQGSARNIVHSTLSYLPTLRKLNTKSNSYQRLLTPDTPKSRIPQPNYGLTTACSASSSTFKRTMNYIKRQGKHSTKDGSVERVLRARAQRRLYDLYDKRCTVCWRPIIRCESTMNQHLELSHLNGNGTTSCTTHSANFQPSFLLRLSLLAPTPLLRKCHVQRRQSTKEMQRQLFERIKMIGDNSERLDY